MGSRFSDASDCYIYVNCAEVPDILSVLINTAMRNDVTNSHLNIVKHETLLPNDNKFAASPDKGISGFLRFFFGGI